MAQDNSNRVSYFINQYTSSLSAFYDGVVFWEIFKNTNRFFITFEEGKYAIPNHKQESIGTIEINYPHVSNNEGIAIPPSNATRGSYDTTLFQGEEEATAQPGVAAGD